MNYIPPDNIKLTRKQKVLYELIMLRLYNKSFNLASTLEAGDSWISGGYRPVYYFRTKEIGGSAGDVRIRELRLDHNVPITCKPHKYYDGAGKKRTAYIYRLELTPDEIREYDWSDAWEKPNWVFMQYVFHGPTFKTDKDGQMGF